MGNVPKHLAKSRRENIRSSRSESVLDEIIDDVRQDTCYRNIQKRLDGANYAIQTICTDFLNMTAEQADMVVKYGNAGSRSHLKQMLKDWSNKA